MPEDVPVTELLVMITRGDKDAESSLFEHFMERAREFAVRNLAKYPRRVQESAGGSAIGLEALRSALSYVGRTGKHTSSSNQFRVLLLRVIKNKIVSVARKESRYVDLGETEPPAKTPSPSDEAIRREAEEKLDGLADHVVELIHKFAKDEIQLMIGDLGVIRSLSAKRIQDEVRAAFPEQEPRSIRAIQVYLQHLRAWLANELGEDFGDEWGRSELE